MVSSVDTTTTSTTNNAVNSDANPFIVFGVSLAILAVVATTYHFLPRNYGRNWIAHAVYWTIAILCIVFLSPTSFAKYIFSGLTVTVVGAVLPIYESIRAVCTPDEDDDKAWLQYWICGGVIFMLTTWVDDVLGETGDAYWDESMFFVFWWLYFPQTDGGRLIYDNITHPYLAPKLKPLKAKMTNLMTFIYQAMVDAVHLWLLWFIFMFLPAGLKRIVAVAVGTVYPFVSSVTAAATEDVEDDTVWLTYWSCYGCLFIIMDILETWLGWIPGFYTVIILTTVYLMLPMFGGAEKVFRKILVPLAGLQELLMLSDAIHIKKSMLKSLDPERAKVVGKAISNFYLDDDIDTVDGLNNELKTGWEGIKMPSLSNPFASKKKETDDGAAEPTETTPIV